MQAFLKTFASDLLEKYGNNLSDLIIVTPSRRANLFLDKYFVEIKQKPVFAPKYLTLGKIFEQFSDLSLQNDEISKISLIWELYSAYKKILTNDETFASFYFFGETLLADFDDIDKSLVDADTLYGSLSEWDKIDFVEALSEEQRKIIQRFFNCDTELKRRFSAVWQILGKLYHDFKTNLKAKKIAYEGMLMRDVLENIDVVKTKIQSDKKIIFAGFHKPHLKKAELNLIKFLQENDLAEFYEENISSDNTSLETKIIASSSASAQVAYLPKFLSEINNPNYEDADTAVILLDENLLLHTIDAVPDDILQNIAILFSIFQTSITGEVIEIIDNFTSKNGDNFSIFDKIQSKIENFTQENISDIEKEAAFHIHKICNKVADCFQNTEMDLSVLKRSLKRIIASTRVPFNGEPAKGLQIMAMQDSRTMNFKNLCFLSANEGNLPKISATNSFIPHSIRKHFGLNTVDKNEEIQRHNFFRLVNSAENISFVYVLGNQGLGNGEMSRFLLQMLVDDKYKVSQYFIKENKIEKAENKIIEVEKTPEIYQKIIKKYDSKTENANILSPTALNRYIDCPLQFYFRYVAEIKKPDDSSNMDAAKLGSVLHKVMENFYVQKLEKIDDNLVEISFNEFFNINKEDYSGEHLIFIDVIKEMAKNIVDFDKKSQNLEILGVEKKVEIEVKLDNNISVKIGGTIDRMDNISTSNSSASYCRIVDYKTGKAPNSKDIAFYAKEVEKLFGEKRKNPANYIFQIFLYSYILQQNRTYDRISSALIYPLQLRDEDYSPVVIDDFNEIKDNFEEEFLKKLNELFNLNTPFTQCENEASCKYCDYKNLCSRV